jgi:predicted Rossmann fold nucleotide-binding protein DprA/Smf involved in DNA uptake
MAGARLVQGPQDVLELLYEEAPAKRDWSEHPGQAHSPQERSLGRRSPETAQPTRTKLEPHLQETLELVGAGHDTPTKLASAGSLEDVLPALTELELLGLLARGDGGRYVPREPLASRPSR